MPDKMGFVYIMTNPSMPRLVKVGMSRRVPFDRASDDDLTSTGIPDRFEPQYYAFFDDMAKAEKEAHIKLSKYHYGKEFFKTDVATAIAAIESSSIPFTKHYSKPEADREAAQIRAKREAESKERERREKLKKESQKRELKRIREELQRRIEHRRKTVKKVMLWGTLPSGFCGLIYEASLGDFPSGIDQFLGFLQGAWAWFLLSLFVLVPIWRIWDWIIRLSFKKRLRSLERT